MTSTRYPPTLITTPDIDDRVAPGMAKKFAGPPQAASRSRSDSDSRGNQGGPRRRQAGPKQSMRTPTFLRSAPALLEVDQAGQIQD